MPSKFDVKSIDFQKKTYVKFWQHMTHSLVSYLQKSSSDAKKTERSLQIKDTKRPSHVKIFLI